MVERTPSASVRRADERCKWKCSGCSRRRSSLRPFRTPESLNTELRRIILARESANESVERSNRGGWQSTWDMHEWGGAPIQKVLAYARALVDDATVDRAGKHHEIAWRIDCWANVSRNGHGNQFHTHPGALWSVNYYVDDGGIGDRSFPRRRIRDSRPARCGADHVRAAADVPRGRFRGSRRVAEARSARRCVHCFSKLAVARRMSVSRQPRAYFDRHQFQHRRAEQPVGLTSGGEASCHRAGPIMATCHAIHTRRDSLFAHTGDRDGE